MDDLARRIGILLALSFVLSSPAFARFGGDKRRAEVELLSSVKRIVPGQSFDLGIHFKLDKGWHIYWKNGGDAGLPPRVTWNLPDGFKAGELQFPVPQRYVDKAGLTSYIHEGEPVLLVRITPPSSGGGRDVSLGAKIKYLICKEICIWEDAQVGLDVRFAETGADTIPANEAVFKAARRALPRDSSKYVTIDPSITDADPDVGDKFELVLGIEIAKGLHIQSNDPSLPSLVGCDVFIAPTEGIYFEDPVYPPPKTRTVKPLGKLSEYTGKFNVRIPAELAEEAPKDGLHFSGVLRFQACTDSGQCHAPEAVAFSFTPGEKPDTRVGASGEEAAPPATRHVKAGEPTDLKSSSRDDDEVSEAAATIPGSDEGGGFFRRMGLPGLLIACFLYGLFINATPCVLPVLSIKVLGFVQQAHESRARTLVLGLAFGAGVMVFFVILGLLAGRGTNLLHFPVAVIALGTIVMALALSMLGVYTLQVPTAASNLESKIQQEGVLASFGKGALAPVLGFACTGPLLAGAFGWAAQQPPRIAIIAFLFAGLGMASPYMLLGANPKWLSFLPKPGNWMITFERIMGFLLLGMVLWLLHPLTVQIGVEGFEWTLAFLVVVAMGCWLLGKINLGMPTGQRWRYRSGAGALIAVGAVLVYGWICPLDEAAMHTGNGRMMASNDTEGIPWRPWSREAVEREVRSGKMVFVDFTAAYCTVCKANKKVATNTPEVRAKLEALDVVPFQGDYTTGDPEIFAVLKEHGRVGVPLNLIYPPGRPDSPILLRPNLTKSYLLDKLEEARSTKTATASGIGA